MKRNFKKMYLSIFALLMTVVSVPLTAGERPSVWAPVKEYAKNALNNTEGIVAGLCASSLYLVAKATSGLKVASEKPRVLVASAAVIAGAYYIAKQYQPAWQSINQANKVIADYTNSSSCIFWAIPYAHQVAVNPYEYLQLANAQGYQQALQHIKNGIARSEQAPQLNGATDRGQIKSAIAHAIHQCDVALKTLERHATILPSVRAITEAQTHQSKLDAIQAHFEDLTAAVESTTFVTKMKRYFLPSDAATQAYTRLMGVRLILAHMQEALAQ